MSSHLSRYASVSGSDIETLFADAIESLEGGGLLLDRDFNIVYASQAFAAQAPHGGCIINLIDSQVPRGIAGHAAYAAAKAGQLNLTRSLAKELAPALRVNAVAPGAILWPEPPPPLEKQRELLAQIPLGRLGEEAEIAEAVCFLVRARYITGQVLAVDGGRGL